MARRNKTKEQLLAERKHREGVQAIKKVGSERLIPVLTAHDLTIHQASQVLEVMKTVIMGRMNQHWEDKKVEDLALIEELTKDENAKQRELYLSLLEHLSDYGINDTLKLLDFYARIVEMYGQRKVLQEKFTELPIDEIVA